MLALSGDNRNKLNRGRTRAGYRNAFADELNLIPRLARHIERQARETVDPFERRRISHGRGEYSDRRDQELRTEALLVLQSDLPAIRLLIVTR
jgi:hypothetical protein